MRSASIVALSLLIAACGQNDSDNVLAAGGNALSPEQLDAALGPEIANVANVADANAVNAAEAAETADIVEEPARPDPPTQAEPEPEEELGEAAPTEENRAEE